MTANWIGTRRVAVLLAIIACVQARSAELHSAQLGSDAQVASSRKAANADMPPNTLSAEEKQLGWKLLFDGKKIEGWRSYGTNTFPQRGWVVENGTLHKQAGERPGDIMTVDTYVDFELTWEWKLMAKGNNGVKYFITEKRGTPVGHEYQMIDDTRALNEYTTNASFCFVLKPATDKPNKPMGVWNRSRLVVQGNHVEHWLNGRKVLQYECGSPEVMNRVSKTRFREYPGFGEKIRGHILLTDHEDPCWYRNLKIRVLHGASRPGSKGD